MYWHSLAVHDLYLIPSPIPNYRLLSFSFSITSVHIKYSTIAFYQMSRVVRKLAFCRCENKDADQLRGNREADQRLCFRYTDSTISLLPKYEISRLQPSSVAVQPGLCWTWSETRKTGLLTTRLKLYSTGQYIAVK